MGFFGSLFGGSKSGGGSGSKKPYRQETGRYGKKGQYRTERNGDRVGRGSDGRYTK